MTSAIKDPSSVKKLVIIGAGGHGKVVADAAMSTCQYDSISFLDGRYPALEQVMGLSVIGNDDCIMDLAAQQCKFIVAIGDIQIRKRIYLWLESMAVSLDTVIHKNAVVSNFATLGKGTVVFSGVTINPDASIGSNVIINTGAIVEHDCVVGDHSHLGPGSILSGGCNIGQEVLFGARAVALPCCSVGDRSSVGAGAVVVNSVPAAVTAKGIPARW